MINFNDVEIFLIYNVHELTHQFYFPFRKKQEEEGKRKEDQVRDFTLKGSGAALNSSASLNLKKYVQHDAIISIVFK